MVRDINSINAELRELQTKWFKDVCQKWINNEGCCPKKMKKWTTNKFGKAATYSFSQPFFAGLQNDIDSSKPLIMFVGQETNGWGYIEDFDINCEEQDKWNIQRSQQSTIDITSNNLKSRVNSSIFWKFIIDLQNKQNNEFNVCWNNLDKIHYVIKNAITKNNKEIEADCVKLYIDDEKELNKPIQCDATLLQLEIQSIRPELVVFLTGRNYKISMESALNTKLIAPTIDCPVQTFLLDKINCLWTYHPRTIYLNKLFDKVANTIGEKYKSNKK